MYAEQSRAACLCRAGPSVRGSRWCGFLFFGTTLLLMVLLLGYCCRYHDMAQHMKLVAGVKQMVTTGEEGESLLT